MRLILFDIDGTLLASNGAGRAAMAYALEKTYGTAGAIETHAFGGSCDRYTVFTLMRQAGLEDAAITAHFDTLGPAMAAHLRSSEQTDLYALAGGQALYEAVHQHEELVLGLVTGNFEESGRVKLQLAGYDDSLIMTGAYGSESMKRADLPTLARERFQSVAGQTVNDMVVIGDTTHDIACAHVNGARALAVSTGSHAAERLKAAKPDLLLDSLTHTERIMAFLLS